MVSVMAVCSSDHTLLDSISFLLGSPHHDHRIYDTMRWTVEGRSFQVLLQIEQIKQLFVACED